MNDSYYIENVEDILDKEVIYALENIGDNSAFEVLCELFQNEEKLKKIISKLKMRAFK